MKNQKSLAIGAKVKYYPLLKDKSNFTVHEVRSDCWDLCGEMVVKITGKSGCVSVEHLELA